MFTRQPLVSIHTKLSMSIFDISSYTQGLEFHNGFLYESTGLNGFSSLKNLMSSIIKF